MRLSVGDIVRDLTWHERRTHLTKADTDLLARGREFLSAEIAVVTGTEVIDARQTINLSQLIAERGVQAAVCAYSIFCDLYLAEFPSLKRHLEGLGIPVLLLELEDDTVSGQHRTRVEAFLEMMEENKP